MSLSEKQVHTIASLARLQLSPSEASALTVELGKILDYVKKLDELDTKDVPPTLQVTVTEAPLRPDVRAVGLTKSEALAEAPRADEVGFLVPGFIE